METTVIEFLSGFLKQLQAKIETLRNKKMSAHKIKEACTAQIKEMENQVTALKNGVELAEVKPQIMEILSRIEILSKELEDLTGLDEQLVKLEQDVLAFKRVIEVLMGSLPISSIVEPSEAKEIVPRISFRSAKQKAKIELLIAILNKHMDNELAPLDAVVEEFKQRFAVPAGFGPQHLNYYLMALGYSIRKRDNMIAPYTQKRAYGPRSKRDNRTKTLAIFYSLGAEGSYSRQDFITKGQELELLANAEALGQIINYIRQNASYRLEQNKLFVITKGKTKAEEKFALTPLGKNLLQEYGQEIEAILN